MRALLAFLLCCGAAGGSNIGRNWGVERKTYNDPVTDVAIVEITGPGSTADNLYYHFSNFTADDKYLLFVSNRSGSHQLFRYSVDSGDIIQLTDDPAVLPRTACPDRKDPRIVYVLRGPEVIRLDILNFSSRLVARIPPPFSGGFQQLSQSGDLRYLAVGKQRDALNWEVGVVDLETGEYRTVTTQGFPITHIQHSPTEPVIFYVWETGGYAPQRTWVVNRDGSGNRPFYAAGREAKQWITPLKEWVTHESYVAGTGEMTMIMDKVGVMLVKPDGTMRIVREGNYWHCAATADGVRIGIDDSQGRIWISDTATGNIRLLATGTRARLPVHAHLSFDHAGRWLQFHTGRSHEGIALIDLKQQALTGHR